VHHDYIEKISLFVIDEEMKENLNIIEEIDKKLNDLEIKVEDNEKDALISMKSQCEFTIKALLDLMNENVNYHNNL